MKNIFIAIKGRPNSRWLFLLAIVDTLANTAVGLPRPRPGRYHPQTDQHEQRASGFSTTTTSDLATVRRSMPCKGNLQCPQQNRHYKRQQCGTLDSQDMLFGAQSGDLCVFPFDFDGITFHSCAIWKQCNFLTRPASAVMQRLKAQNFNLYLYEIVQGVFCKWGKVTDL